VKKLVLAVTVLALCSLSLAETPSANVNNQQEAAAGLAQKNTAQAAPHSPFATSACSFTFTSGANNTFLKYCVTDNGNITQLETPKGHEHIAVGDFAEGYGFCDLNSNVAYDDYADVGDTGNWGPATVVSQTAKSVKIARTTSDRVWTLTQTIAQVAGMSPSVRIGMALRNNTAVDRFVELVRYADVDADSAFLNTMDATFNSAFGWNSVGGNGGIPFGLVLQNLTPLVFSKTGFIQNVPGGPAPCNAFAHFAPGPLTATDGSVVMDFQFPVPKGASKTVTVSYRGL
jgi:hypothetical protein